VRGAICSVAAIVRGGFVARANCNSEVPMPVVPTTAYSQAEDALTLARALMNDSAGAVFTDALLMPLINSAYRGLQRELAENGVSVLAEQQDVDLETDPIAGVTNMEISDVSSPQLPADCLMPHVLWERATANTGDVFVPMEKFTSGGGMLNLQPSSYRCRSSQAECTVSRSPSARTPGSSRQPPDGPTGRTPHRPCAIPAREPMAQQKWWQR